MFTRFFCATQVSEFNTNWSFPSIHFRNSVRLYMFFLYLFFYLILHVISLENFLSYIILFSSTLFIKENKRSSSYISKIQKLRDSPRRCLYVLYSVLFYVHEFNITFALLSSLLLSFSPFSVALFYWIMHRIQTSMLTYLPYNILLRLWWHLISSGSRYLEISRESCYVFLTRTSRREGVEISTCTTRKRLLAIENNLSALYFF